MKIKFSTSLSCYCSDRLDGDKMSVKLSPKGISFIFNCSSFRIVKL